MKKHLSFFLYLSAACFVPGCGGASDGPDLATVSGKVLVDGKPQAGLTVEFHPDSGAGTKGPMSTGVTNAEGSFALATSTGRGGAVIGSHKVLVKCPWTLAGRAGSEAPVTADGFGSSAEGKAPPAPPKSASECTVNIKFEDANTTPLKAVVPAEGVSDLLLQATSE